MAITANNLFAAVKARWDAAAALATAFPGGISRGRAKDVPAHDYTIFTSISNVRIQTSSHSELWLSVFRFSVITPVSPEQAGTKAKVIADAFDPATLTIDGATMQKLRRVSEIDANSGDWNVEQMNVTYECEWSKPRSDQV